MHLRDALRDYKRHRDHDRRFPGERRTTDGRFTGHDGRLIHIDSSGAVRDHSYPLVGHSGIARSRFGVRTDEASDPEWFDAANATQRYVDDTALVETTHETAHGTVVQYDYADGARHRTHFDLRDADGVDIVCYVEFTPDGRADRLAQLHHGDAVEVYHADEANYLASATGFHTVRGDATEFGAVLGDDPRDYPRERPEGRYDDALLTGAVLGVVPGDGGHATLATLLTSRTETPRDDALAAIRDAADADAQTLRDAAHTDAGTGPENAGDAADAVATDLRVLASLTGATGLRIAGPDFDPHYVHSGGYGYAWFRDDAEISGFLRTADRRFDLGLEEWFARSADAYAAAQLDDGTWPHRVWAFDGSLAPGWANGRLEAGDGHNYQADQTASVLSFLADYDDGDYADVVAAGVDGLDASLAADGRPETCQNAWEDMTGRFTHTAATFLDAYATVAAERDDAVGSRAREHADDVYDAIDDLWVESRGAYALREYGPESPEDGLDDRLDSATLALASAHRAYARVGDVDATRRDRLVEHVTTVLDGLERDAGAVRGLVRYEGDAWRQREQGGEKIWTVSTAWGANAAAELAALCRAAGDERATALDRRARELLALVAPGGALVTEAGHLPEQVFDDGTPDSATPLGWPHAIRSATLALLEGDERAATPDGHVE
ncbi:hypothetical protein GCM10009037_23790 [Halarchaeum grantii]|uniref:Glucan 1,4-alpha-glucosidase n=1 Tax=Halarchaeum grantii TaxID=1193105 RepID=A0A830FER1_9EURY|nr:glycoside hydrolase family 15 protein [Halarchaeum grantii]GGL39295.1 hypothetical protein GCM10009037_23790 [Halarchaeum grantii]